MNPNRTWSRGDKLAALISVASLVGSIPVASYEQEIRIGVRKKAISALEAKGIEVDPRWMQGELMSHDQTYVVPGGHFRYDATTNELTFYKSETSKPKDC